MQVISVGKLITKDQIFQIFLPISIKRNVSRTLRRMCLYGAAYESILFTYFYGLLDFLCDQGNFLCGLFEILCGQPNFLYGQLVTFYMVKMTFDMVNLTFCTVNL